MSTPRDTITEAFRREYAENLELLVTNISADVMSYFRVERFQGERKDFPQAGGVLLQPKTGRAAELPVVEMGHRVRWVNRNVYYARDWIDSFDLLRTILDPTSTYLEAFAKAVKVKLWQVGVAGLLGTAYGGKDANVSYTLTGNNAIAAGGTSYTLAKHKAALEQLRRYGSLDPDEMPTVFWTTAQMMDFIDTTEVKSSDFNAGKPMTSGRVTSFFGATFVVVDDYFDQFNVATERILPYSGTTRSCVMFGKGAGILGLPTKEVSKGNVDWDFTRQSWQVSAAADVGATRTNEYQVVKIDCTET